MGGQQSKTSASITNEIIPEVLIKGMQNCSSSSEQSNSANGIHLFGMQSNSSNISQNCIANFKITNEIVNEITNKIQQQCESKGVALLDLISKNKSEANLNLRNIIAPKITNEFMQIVSNKVAQSNSSGGFSLGFFQTNSSEQITKAIMDAVTDTGITTTIDNNSSQTAKSTSENPLAFLTEMFGNWVYLILGIFLIIIVAVTIILAA